MFFVLLVITSIVLLSDKGRIFYSKYQLEIDNFGIDQGQFEFKPDRPLVPALSDTQQVPA